MDAAFCSALLVTLAGSTMPAAKTTPNRPSGVGQLSCRLVGQFSCRLTGGSILSYYCQRRSYCLAKTPGFAGGSVQADCRPLSRLEG